MRYGLIHYLLLLLLFPAAELQSQVVRKRYTELMGSRFDLTVVAADSAAAEGYIDLAVSEMDRIEQLISDWMPASQVSEVNRMAGKQPVKVDPELMELTRRAVWFSELTDGAFDISFAAMDRIWKFDGTMEQFPDSASIKKAISAIGYRFIVLDTVNSTIFLSRPGMKIGFGATGKGYAADKARSLLQQKGVQAGIINASGDLALWGSQPDGSSWRIGISNPYNPSKSAAILSLRRGAVTTSGDYQKYVEINGKRYSHIINPRTGMPVSGITSVTVVGTDAEKCNGFSTSIMVLGKKRGLKLLKQYPEYACLIITDKGKKIKSRNFSRILRKLN